MKMENYLLENSGFLNSPSFSKEGFYDLTIQERKVLRLTIQDFSCKESADQLNISVETVKKHRKNIIKKFQIKGKRDFRRILRVLENDSMINFLVK